MQQHLDRANHLDVGPFDLEFERHLKQPRRAWVPRMEAVAEPWQRIARRLPAVDNLSRRVGVGGAAAHEREPRIQKLHDPTLPADLAPVTDIKRVAIGSDHTGLAIKSALVSYLRGRGVAVVDLGTNSTDPVDYPDIAGAVARSVARRESDAGIAIDGAGIGSAIAANKVRGVRAALCLNETMTTTGRVGSMP